MNIYVLDQMTAQIIVDNIMQTIPYNINIMNSDGVIIASGYKKRIGKTHQGALKVLKNHEPYLVYEDTETEKQGINLPIEYSGEIVGVLGISGEPSQTQQIAQIVVSVAKLMIDNRVYMKVTEIKEGRLQDFLFEWAQKEPEEYSCEFLERANFLGINLDEERVAVILTCDRIRYSIVEKIRQYLEKNEYLIQIDLKYMTVLLSQTSYLWGRLEEIMNGFKEITGCFVGTASKNVRFSKECARSTYEVALLMKWEKKVIFYENIQLEIALSNMKITDGMDEKKKMLLDTNEDIDAINTIFAYVKNSENVKSVCDLLHIHRNTLNYRIQRLFDLTGYNIKNGRDMGMLYMLAILAKKALPDL